MSAIHHVGKIVANIALLLFAVIVREGQSVLLGCTCVLECSSPQTIS